MKYAQTEDAIYFAHPDYQLVKLPYKRGNFLKLGDAEDPVILTIGYSGLSQIDNYVVHEEDDTFNAIALPPAPAGSVRTYAWSPNAKILAIGETVSPYIEFYEREGQTFTKITGEPDTTTADPYSLDWTEDTVYLACASGAAGENYMGWYKFDGGTDFTKLTNPTLTPGATAQGCSWTPDGVYLAFAVFSATDTVLLYKRSGDTLTQVDKVSITGGAYDCHFSPDGSILAVGLAASPYLKLYKVVSDALVAITGPVSNPPGIVNSCRFSPDGNFLACACQTTPFLACYRRHGEILTSCTVDIAAAGIGEAVSWSPFEGKYVALGHQLSPYLTIYKRTGSVFNKDAQPGTAASTVRSVEFTIDGWDATHWNQDYPAAIAFHEQRMIVGKRRKVWASKVGYIHSFVQDASDASYGYSYQFASDVLEEIRWIVTQNHNIILGTGYGEWLMTGGNQPISNANVYVDRTSAHGSTDVAAVLANESVVFVQKGGQRLREFMYSEERGGYISPDLTLLADHIGVLGFKELEWQRSPRSILWTVRDNGELAALTLDRNHNIQAWHRHPTDGTVESVAVIPGADEDVVYMVVKRTINAAEKKYIEYLKPINRPGDEEDYFFVDCGKTLDYSAVNDAIEGATQADPVVITATGHPFVNDEKILITGVVGMTELNGNVYTVKGALANSFQLYDEPGTGTIDGTGYGAYVSGGTIQKVTKTFSGLTHLEAKTVKVYADGNQLGDETVSSGSITIDAYAAKIHVGLSYTGTVYTQRLGNFSNVLIPEGKLLLYKTRGGKIGQDANNLKAIQYRTDQVVTEPQEIQIGCNFSDDGSIMVVQDQPYPMTILGIVASMVGA